MTDHLPPSQRGAITEPLSGGDPGFSPRWIDGVRYTGIEFLALQFKKQGSPWNRDGDAAGAAQEVYHRYPAIANDDHITIPELMGILHRGIGCEHGTDLLGLALDLLDYMERTL